MEEVVVIKETFRDGRLEQISFSKLEDVDLRSLPSLKRFSSADCIEFPSLKELICFECGTSTDEEEGEQFGTSTDEEEVEERELIATQPLFTEKVNSF